ncbi:MAG TPA: hypothetical protein VE959_12715 [Bryobacteraceae bacterium]|nr:hypothetical protein [Bryobacteraceae bacterium]
MKRSMVSKAIVSTILLAGLHNAAAQPAPRRPRGITLTLAITFSQNFAGGRIFYLSARNASGQDSGWQAAGTNTVP